MALINDYQQNNDPRRVINQIDDPAPIRPVVPLNAAEQEQLQQDVPEVLLDVEDEAAGREQLEPNNELPVQPQQAQTVVPNLNDFTPISGSQQIFPSVSDINQQTTEEAQQLQNQEIERASQSLQSGMLTGTVYPTLYEAESDISRMDAMVSKTNELVHSSVENSIKEISKQLHNPIQTRIQTPTSRGDRTPSLDSSRTLGQNIAGSLSPIYNSLSRSFNDGNNEFLSSTVDDDKFSPLKGFYTFADNVMKDPLSAVPSILNPIGGGILGDSTFGEYGKGGLGALLYGLDLFSNVPIAAATDLLNKIQNKETPNNQPNWLQALQGQDYSFSSVQKENGQNRLSVVAPLDTEITTWKELKDRSWANKFHPDILLAQGVSGLLTGDFNKIPEAPGNIVKGITEFVTGNEELAESMPGRIIQAKEFMVGLGLDAVTGDIFENAFKGAKKGVGKLFGKRGAKEATERAATSLATESPELLADSPTIDVTVTPADQAIVDFNAKVGEVEEVLSRNLDDTNLRPTLGGEAKTSDVVDSLTQAPLELEPNFVKQPATLVSPPVTAFPSKVVDVDGITRQTTDLLNTLGADITDFKIVTPEITDTIRRSNSELTNLAIARGDIPSRSTPLSSRRLELLNEAHDGVYSRYGQRLDEFEVKVPKELPEADKLPMKVADNYADDVVNVPSSKSAIIEYQNLHLPKSLVSRTDEGINLTRRYMRNSQVYDDLASESAELQLKFSQELEAVTQSIEQLEELPDIGRRTLLESPELPVEYIPPTTPPVSKIVPDEELVKEVNSLQLYHGTKSPTTDLSVVDPVKGASRSEMGVGLHLTTDEELALSYSAAAPTRNLPSVETRKIEARGIIKQYQPKLETPVDVTKELTPEIVDTLVESVNSIPSSELNSVGKKILRNHLKKKRSMLEFFDKMEDVGQRYYLDDGLDYPEEAMLNLQRIVTQNLRSKLGVDSLVYKAPDGRIQVSLLGSPNSNGVEQVGELITPSTIRTNAVTQSTYRNNVDTVAAEMFPNSKYARVNAAESKVNLMTQMSQRTAEQLDSLSTQLSSVADDLASQESALRKQVIAEKGERLARKEKIWNKRNQTQINHWNKPEDGIC